MTYDRGFEEYRQQLLLIAEWMSASRASNVEKREAGLKAVCEQAVLSLSRDLQAITAVEERLADFGRKADAADESRQADSR